MHPLSSKELAGKLFDELIVSTREARTTESGNTFFPLAANPDADSYFSAPAKKTLSAADFTAVYGNNEDLLTALAKLWEAEQQDDLNALLPGLHKIVQALQNEHRRQDGDVDILCYTLF